MNINARIGSTVLGIEDHGILTFFLHMEWDGGGQGFGGYALDSYDRQLECHVGSAFGVAAIRGVLDTLEVDRREKLAGKYCRIRHGEGGSIEEIGHIVRDKWFNIGDCAKEYRDG